MKQQWKLITGKKGVELFIPKPPKHDKPSNDVSTINLDEQYFFNFAEENETQSEDDKKLEESLKHLLDNLAKFTKK